MPISSTLGLGLELRSFALGRVRFSHLIRLDVNLIGVAPEKEIMYPRINPAQRRDNELTNGHTHFFLLGDETKKFEWGEETKLKFDLAQR